MRTSGGAGLTGPGPRRRITGLSAALAALAVSGAVAAQDLHTIDAATAPAGTYRLDKAHSSVTLRISYGGLSYAVMRVDRFDGSLYYDPAHPERAKLQVSLDAASLDSGDPVLDRLVADQVLQASKYPQVRFTATEIKPTIEGRGQVRGDLTLHGQTHPVDLDVLFNGAAQDTQHATHLGFSANATLDREAFGASGLRPAAGDEVSIDVEVEFKT